MYTRIARSKKEAKTGRGIFQKYGGGEITAENFMEGMILVNVGPNGQVNGVYDPGTKQCYASDNVRKRMEERLVNA